MPKTVILRMKELTREVNPRPVYPTLNVACFQDTETVTGQMIIDFLKKTNGTRTAFGEVAKDEEGYQFLQMRQSGSDSTNGTHHGRTAPTTFRDMARKYMAVSHVQYREALETVLQSLDIDIHLEKDAYGHRYIDRITVFCPFVTKAISKDPAEMWRQFVDHSINDNVFVCVDLMRFDPETRTYKYTGEFSPERIKEMKQQMTVRDREEFDRLLEAMHSDVEQFGGAEPYVG